MAGHRSKWHIFDLIKVCKQFKKCVSIMLKFVKRLFP